MNRFVNIAAALLFPTLAFAQSGAPVKQSGNVSAGHSAAWVSPGVIQDGGATPVNVPMSGGSTTSVSSSSTVYCSPSGCNTSQALAGLSAISGVLSNLNVAVNVAPGVGQTVIATLYTGTYGTLASTTLTCTISGASKSCSDSSDTATIVAGQAWAIQLVTSSGAASTTGQSFSTQLTALYPPPLPSTQVRQSGNITSGHAVIWVAPGVIQDAGFPLAGPAVPGVVGPNTVWGNPTNASAAPVFTTNPTITTPATNDNSQLVATTAYVNNKIRVIHSLDYAVGNGSADDTTALQSWINACQGTQPSTVCFLDAGFYKTSSGLLVTNCINIDGAGRDAAQINPSNGTQNGITINTNCSYGRIANISIDPIITKTAGSSILLTAPVSNVGWIFENLYLINDFAGIATVNGQVFLIDKVVVSCLNTCISIVTGGDGAISNSVILPNGATNTIGINCLNCDGIKIANTKVLSLTSGSQGVVWQGTSSCTSCSDFFLSNLSVEVQSVALNIVQGSTVSMANVAISGGEYASGTTSAISIANDNNTWLHSVAVTGAVISGQGSVPALIVGSSQAITVSGDTIVGNGASTYGIQVSSNATACVLGSNSISGTVTGSINDASGNCQQPYILPAGSAVSNIPIGSVAYSSLGNVTTLGATGTWYITSIFVPGTFTVNTINVLQGSTVTTNKLVGYIYNAAVLGTPVAKTPTAGVITGSANTFLALTLTGTGGSGPVTLVGPATYYLVIQGNGSTDSIRTVAASTYVGVLTQAAGSGTFGTAPTITLPTSFTANVAPIAYLN